MKKIFILFIAVLASLTLLFCLSSCSSSESVTLNVYNWGEYISDGSDDSIDVIAEFEKWYEKEYGVKMNVNYTTYASNEDLYTKIVNGVNGYDIIFPSDYMIARLANEGLLEDIDFDNIPNYKHIGDEFKGLYYDPDEKYTVPYTYGITGVIYNKKHVSEEDVSAESWDIMWNEKYAGKILQYNNSRDAFGTAMYKLGIDVNTTDHSQWDTVYKELVSQQGLIQAYVMDEIYNKMESGEAWVSSYYAGDYLTMLENNPDLGFYYPKRTNFFIDAMCIPKGSKNKLAAERFINFMLTEDIAVANAEYIYYASPNDLVCNSQEYKDYMGDGYDLLYNSNSFGEDFDFSSSYDKYCFKSLDNETLAYVTSLWEKLKIESPMDPTIYIVCGACIAVIVTFFIINIIKKKRREKSYD